jgi:hypothetical protein
MAPDIIGDLYSGQEEVSSKLLVERSLGHVGIFVVNRGRRAGPNVVGHKSALLHHGGGALGVDTASGRLSARATGTGAPLLWPGDWAQVLLQVAEQVLAHVLAQVRLKVSWQVSARWD